MIEPFDSGSALAQGKLLSVRQCDRKAFTLIELLVVVAILSLLVSILLPSLTRARVLANSVYCQGNLKGLATWGQLYAADWNDTLPTRGTPADLIYWDDLSTTDWLNKAGNLYVYGTKSGTAMHCPQAAAEFSSRLRTPSNGTNYGLNAYLGGKKACHPTYAIPKPQVALLSADLFWFGDGTPKFFTATSVWDFDETLTLPWFLGGPNDAFPWNWNVNVVTPRPSLQTHPGGANNFVFGDGHVEGITEDFFNYTMTSIRRQTFTGYTLLLK